MLPLLFIAVGIWLTNIFDGAAETSRSVAQTYRAMVKENQVREIAAGVAEFYRDTGNYPPDLDALVSAPGRQHLRSSRDNWQGYAVSGDINDTVWRFRRAATFLRDPTDGTTPATYLTVNRCGTGPATTATSWCGSDEAKWFREESRLEFNDQIARQRARLNMVLQKIATHYNATQTLPDRNFAGATLGNDTITRMAALVNYAGPANACTGNYVWVNSIPIECEDMFDIWGGHVGYQFITNKRIILVSESPITNSAGVPVRIAATLDLTGL